MVISKMPPLNPNAIHIDEAFLTDFFTNLFDLLFVFFVIHSRVV